MDFADSDEGGRALLYATEKGDGALVKALLLLGVDVNFISADGEGMTALTVAVACGHSLIVKLLIAAGADVNARSSNLRTPLMVARDNEIIKDLLDSGANVLASDSRG